MSKQFKAGRAHKTKGSMNVSFKGAPDIVKKLRKLEHGGEVAIQRTVSDFASRAPGWVSQGVREHYGISRDDMLDYAPRAKRGKTSIKVAGVTVDGVTLKYSGRTLTPLHFKMSPTGINPKGLTDKKKRIPGQAVNFKKTPPGQVAMASTPKKYTVKATIIKGKRVSMEAGTYLAPASKKNPDSPIIPFQRTGEGRTPVHAVRTLSVPQMIDGRAKETINEIINKKMEERFNNQIKRIMK